MRALTGPNGSNRWHVAKLPARNTQALFIGIPGTGIPSGTTAFLIIKRNIVRYTLHTLFCSKLTVSSDAAPTISDIVVLAKSKSE